MRSASRDRKKAEQRLSIFLHLFVSKAFHQRYIRNSETKRKINIRTKLNLPGNLFINTILCK